eukprot:TRINITY_DN1550_c0_g2_i1.p1 TRINITY_DN1550_c0_g2~~TRINITY_DN1550_c0_g2_i1.p1  ORF type:complete len:998 (+),score=342.85 TRINITY_DN1550_c0_g2_i1:240-3233(+)
MSQEAQQDNSSDHSLGTTPSDSSEEEIDLNEEKNEEQKEKSNGGESFQCPKQPESPLEEKKLIDGLRENDDEEGLKKGKNYYLISHPWMNNWEEWCKSDGSPAASSSSSSSSSSNIGTNYYNEPYGYSSSFVSYNKKSPAKKPEPIDNTTFIKEDNGLTRINDNAAENHHFRVLSESEWKTLHSWYGGGPELKRKVIQFSSLYSTNLKLEINPLTLKLYHSSDLKKEKAYVQASKSSTLREFKLEMCEQFGYNPDKVRIVDFHQNKRYAIFTKSEELRRLDDARIMDNQSMLIDEPDEKGDYVVIKEESSSGYGYGFSSSYVSRPVPPGTTGLGNLGNTCFMNSSVQCLSHTGPLIDYFTKNLYTSDINENNPLGSGGVLANTYAELIKELWSGRGPSHAPREFKRQLEQFAPQFAGYQQHDSQELLAYLLDGIHEDVNKIRNKPYVEMPEVGDRKQEEVAQEAWGKHKSRNDSIIVDYFQGQLKSTLVCPECDRVSITFDPFMYLSLPIPTTTKRTYFITVYKLTNDIPIKYACQVPKSGTVKNLIEQLALISGLNAQSLALTKMDGKSIDKYYEKPDDSVDNISERANLAAFEIDMSDSMTYYPISWEGDKGSAFILSVKNGPSLNYEELYDAIYDKLRRVLKVPQDRICRTVEDVIGESSNQADESMKMSLEVPVSKKQRNIDSESDEDESKGSDEEKNENPTHQQKKKKNTTPLFVISKMGQYRYSWSSKDDTELKNNGRPLNVEDRSSLVLEMDRNVYREIFDREADSLVEEHETTKKARMENDEGFYSRKPISLKKCIELFSEVEKLGPDDPWYCSKCKEMRRATKKFDLWKLPPVLVVHLKRFYHKNRFYREKLDSTIDFPITGLDLTEFVQAPYNQDEEPIYDLYAVSNHYGSLGGGHYTALAKNRLDDHWYKFDDSHVTKTSEDNLVDSSAYVLFYQRRDITRKEKQVREQETAAAASASASSESNTNGDEAMETESDKELDMINDSA